MKNIRSLIVGAVFAAVALCASAQAADEPIVIKFSHVAATDAPKGKGALKFKELAEQRSNGQVKVEVYANSSLYKDKEELEALQLGAVQMLAPSAQKFGPMGVRELDVFDLPYLFEDYAQLRKVTDGQIGQTLLKKLEPKGMVGLAYWGNGFRDLHANKPLRSPEDVHGLKMRVAGSKVSESSMRALGAIPQNMAFSEVYQALQTGVVDGTENMPSNFYTQKMHEVQKYLTLTDHSVIVYTVVVNKKFWEGLRPNIRAVLEGAMKDATKFVNESAKQENDDALQAVKKSGKTQIITPTLAEKNAWKKTLMKVHQEYEGKIGKDLIHAIYKEIGFNPNKL